MTATPTTAGTGHPTLPAPDPSKPVIVLGNGPVGQSVALLLASWNVHVVLLDSRPERDPIGSKAICQQRDVLDIWDHVGAGRQIADEGLTWTQATTLYHDDELFTQGFVDRGESPFPPFVNISQARTEAVLDERIAATPHIDVRWGHQVVGIDQDEDGVTFSCVVSEEAVEAGTVDAPADDLLEVRGAYAVVCCGARGDAIRKHLGLTFDGKTFEDQFLICDIKTTLPGWENERRFYFDPVWNPGRQVLIHPCPDSTFRIDWQVPPDYSLKEEEESGKLEDRIRMIIGDADYEIVWHSVYRFHSRQVNRMRVGKVLIAGDAAHLVSPFGARGLNSGVPDAENAAWKVALVVHGLAGEELLETYHTERDAAAKENLEITTNTMRFLVPQTEEEAAHRKSILEAAGDDPEARKQVDSGRLAEAFWYVDSPLTTAHPDYAFDGRPAKGSLPDPGPGILVPDVRISSPEHPGVERLRTIARRGLTVLLTADVDADAENAIREAAQGTGAPVTVLNLGTVTGGENAASAVGAKGSQAWILRPDAYVSAIVDDPGAEQVVQALNSVLMR